MRHDLAHQTDPPGLGGIDHIACEQELCRFGRTNDGRQTVESSEVADESTFD